MKKIFTFAVMFAAVAMVSCAGQQQKPAEAESEAAVEAAAEATEAASEAAVETVESAE